MKRYAEVLRVPHVATLIAATLIARFPIGINALALILYLRPDPRAGGACSCRSRSSTPRRSAVSSGWPSSARPRR